MITINGDLQPNNGEDGEVYQSNGVRVLRTGGSPYVLFMLPYPVAVHWDGRRRVRITVSTEYGRECCVDYVEHTTVIQMTTFALPDGSITTSISEFGSSWLYSNTSSTCEELPPSGLTSLLNN